MASSDEPPVGSRSANRMFGLELQAFAFWRARLLWNVLAAIKASRFPVFFREPTLRRAVASCNGIPASLVVRERHLRSPGKATRLALVARQARIENRRAPRSEMR